MKQAPRGLQRTIDRELERGAFKRARDLLLGAIRENPSSHWLWTTLSEVYVQQKQDARALTTNQRAIRLAPHCPLVLWNHANALDLLGRESKAIQIWRKLLRQGERGIPKDSCWESKAWSQALLNDCQYRLGHSLLQLGRLKPARHYLNAHLIFRAEGVKSIYSKKFVEKSILLLRRKESQKKRTKIGGHKT